MDLLQTVIGDGALLLFSLAGLTATGIAIVRDTQRQRADAPGIRVRADG